MTIRGALPGSLAIGGYRPDRVFGLDAVRALAILLVLFAHSLFLISDPAGLLARSLFHILAFLGVELFFVLSGFLIGGIIMKSMGSREDITLGTLKGFWVRRWFRTLPNYYLVLLSQLAVLYVVKGGVPLGYLNFFSFTQNFAGKHPPFFNEAWTLAVEEWFYLLFPLSVVVCSSLVPRRLDVKTIFKVVIFVFLAAGLAGRVAASLYLHMSWAKGIRGTVIYRLDSIMFGVLFAYLAYYHGTFLERHRKGFFLMGGLLVLFCTGKLGYHIINNSEGFFLQTFLFSCCSFGMASLLPLAATLKKEQLPSLAGAITHVSAISYSAYLIHNVIILQLLAKLRPSLGSYPAYLLFWVLTLVCSTALYKAYERPFMSLRERFSARPAATSP